MFDPVYWLFIGPTLALTIWAQWRVKRAMGKWGRVPNLRGITGAEAAHAMLQKAGLSQVTVEQSKGFLSDHYDPRTRGIRLSERVYSGRSVAAIGIACHEAGHAIQHATHYAPLALRNAIVPVASIGSRLAMPMIFLGLILHMQNLVLLGIAAFAILVVFQLITLPAEFDASRRAKETLRTMGLVQTQGEGAGVAAVLDAAALTYVAATLSAIAQLAYFLLLSGRRR
ncbi:MAG: zinc metallopeptidase [Gemmatimonadota bacterium]|jgi:hypothetical protein|nr:zinc metallopeptidase [Gemmatimonadota bacterium]MDP6529605.1 zinc metallopeptidase [Gemmatimonadota bacterium]MDP6802930.1 zinc metallopeptidase [Gemmatimonadota bacterium]MDP7030658.1 zinc metallopeptidase [Gemmatimonadota bacterium]